MKLQKTPDSNQNFTQILAGDNKRGVQGQAEMRPRAEALPRRRPFRSRYRPLSAARQSRASCKPLSSAVKHGGADVSMSVPIKSVNIDPFRCTGGGICSQRYSRRRTRRRLDIPGAPENFGNAKTKDGCSALAEPAICQRSRQVSI